MIPGNALKALVYFSHLNVAEVLGTYLTKSPTLTYYL